MLSHLVKLIREAGVSLKTGFVGTPYILHALIEGGEAELAYDLLLREEYPSWLYPVTMGATTIWEHWDGLRPDGKLWSPTMNSYNHYAYGAVADWIFGCAAGIMPREPGYKSVLIAPTPSRKLGKLCAEYNSRVGKIRSSWEYVGNRVKFSVLTPTDATVIIAGKKHECTAGEYSFEVEAND